jgi:hypothetical protein
MTTNLALPLGFGLALLAAVPMAHAQTMPDQSAPPSAPDQGGEHHHGGGGQRGFDAIDTNHDGFITLDEWKAAGRREERFAKIDVNHTGRITRDDLRAWMEKMRAQRQQSGGGDHDGQ